MAIFSTPPTPPSSSDVTNFRQRGDAFLSWMASFATELSGQIGNINSAVNISSDFLGELSSVTVYGTSSTSLSVGTGGKTLTVETGKGFQAGHLVKVIYSGDPFNQYMRGVVVSYDSGTGALSIDVDQAVGSGTYGSWFVYVVPSLMGSIAVLTAGEDIPANSAVFIDHSGEARVAKTGFGADVVFNAAGTNYISCCYDSVNNAVVVCYRNTTDNKGYAVVGTVSGDTVSFGAPVMFSNGNNVDFPDCCYDSSNGCVVVCFSDSSDGGKGKAVVGTVSGNSISFGTPVVFDSGAVNRISCCYDSGNSKVVVAYSGSSNYGYSVVGTVSGDSISFGTAVIFQSATTYFVDCCYDSYNGKVVVCYSYSNTSGKARVGTVSVDTITFGAEATFSSGDSDYISCCYVPSSRKVVVVYSLVSASISGYVVGTVSGESISFGNRHILEHYSVANTSCCYDNVTGTVVILYREGFGNGLRLSFVSVTDDSESVIVRSYLSRSQDNNALCAASDGKLLFARSDNSSTYGTASVIDPQKAISIPIGICPGGATIGSPATVYLGGSVHRESTLPAGLVSVDSDGILTSGIVTRNDGNVLLAGNVNQNGHHFVSFERMQECNYL